MTDDTARKVATLDAFIHELVPQEHWPMLDWALFELGACLHEELQHTRDSGFSDGQRDGALKAWRRANDIMTAATHRATAPPATVPH